MQIYSDVTGCAIRVAANTQAAAVGAAIFGASAAGLFPSLYDAASVMGRASKSELAQAGPWPSPFTV